MLDYDHLRTVIAQKLREGEREERGGERVSARFSAPTLYIALQKAATACECEISDLAYEVLVETGDAKNNDTLITIRAEKKMSEVEEPDSSMEDDLSMTGDPALPPTPSYSIKKQRGEILVRVDPLRKRASRITEADLQAAVQTRTEHQVDIATLKDCARHADGTYRVVGSFAHDVRQDATHRMLYDSGNLTAHLTLVRPQKYGNEYSIKRILAILENEGVVYGVDRTLLREIEEYPRYNHAYLIARGAPPAHGKDARILYSERLKAAMASTKGQNAGVTFGKRVNYKEHSTIVNVFKGDPLAYLVPAEAGRDGKSVFGDVVRAKDGNETVLRVGDNVELQDDERTAVAVTDGQFRVVDGVFVVNPLYNVMGDVGMKSGNVLFLGDVVVHGNVDDGFSVRASGIIDVYGFVGAAQLDSELGVNIRRGIAGKGGAFINSGGDCSVQYIEHAVVHAAGSVIVNDSIIQSQVVAGQSVRCTGKRAHIVGGAVTGGLRVAAKAIGADSGVRTKISVGVDPFLVMRMDTLRNRRALLSEQLRHLKLMQRKSGVQLKTGDFEYKMSKVEQVHAEVSLTERELATLEDDIVVLNEEITATQSPGEICGTRIICQNVEVAINRVTKLLTHDYERVCFTMTNGTIVGRTISVNAKVE